MKRLSQNETKNVIGGITVVWSGGNGGGTATSTRTGNSTRVGGGQPACC